MMGLGKFFGKIRGEPTQDWFAGELIRMIRAAGDAREYRYDRGEGRIVRMDEDSPGAGINLSNMFQRYLAMSKKDRPEHLRICLRTILASRRELPDDFEAARHDLRPRLWSRFSFEMMRLDRRLGSGLDMTEVPSRPIGDHLVLTLAYDWPESVQSINQGNLDTWGVTFDEAMEAATSNLGEATEGYGKFGDLAFYAFASGDSYDATRIVLTDLVSSIEVPGRPVAMVPNRDTLFVVGEDDEDALALLAKLAVDGLAEPYAISAFPLVLDDGEWAGWSPPEGHPARPQFNELRSQATGQHYAEQKEKLDAIHQKEGIDLFTASFAGGQTNDGRLVTYCTWGDGVDALLPETGTIVLMNEAEGMAALGDWARVREVVGHRMEPTEHYPPRWRVRSFPDGAELAAIGKGNL